MATADLLSQHSSNPLEVSSSDIRNRAAVRKYREATQNRYFAEHESSAASEVLTALRPTEVEQYHDLISTLYPDTNIPASHSVRNNTLMPLTPDEDEHLYDTDIAMAALCPEGDEDAEGDDDPDLVAEETYYEGTDEENTILLKSREEQHEIQEEITELEMAVPHLTPDYKIIDRLGTGTFSSVYKAIDLGYHDKWYNSEWHGTHPTTSSAHYQSVPRQAGSKVFVAIKRIYVTSGPERIKNEIMILEDCRMCRHVSQLITAFRHEDQVVAIMPYHRNEDFRVCIYPRKVQ